MAQVDSFFTRGSSHSICQDYTLADGVGERQIVAVSDGCSGSPHTDFGARYLCLGAGEALRLSPTGGFSQDAVLPLACTLLGKILPVECLDATLLVAYPTPEHTFVLVSGDGVVAARDREGLLHVWEVEYPNNAPLYLSYLLNQRRLSHLPGVNRQVTKYRLDLQTQEIKDCGTWYEDVTPSDPHSFWRIFNLPQQRYDLVCLFSDGIQSFQRKTERGGKEAVPVPEVLQQVMAFKGTRGEFVTRRCRRFFGRFCMNHGWSHYDDFSMGAIYREKAEQATDRGVE